MKAGPGSKEQQQATRVVNDATLVDLRILATSDIHGWLEAWDYHSARPLPAAGLARTATLIEKAREGAENSLLFDNGDFLQGSPLAEWSAGNPEAPHPIIAAMNHLHYDAATLGNHEFNFGLEMLEGAVAQAGFPIVSANISRLGGTPLVPRTTVLHRQVADRAGRVHPLRVGVIGFLPVQVMIWDHSLLTGRVEVETPLAAARRHVATLRQRCDLLVALCHGGIGCASAAEGSEDFATAIAGVAGVDVVIAGHSHLVFPDHRFRGLEGVDAEGGSLQGKPAVMPGSRGSHLGLVDLQLEVRDWSVASSSSRLVAAGPAPPAPSLRRVIGPAHDAVRREMDRPLGHSDVPLNSFFALVAPSRATALVAEASARHVRNLLGDDLPVLGTGQPFKVGGRGGAGYFTDVPAGPLSLRHANDLYVYPNTLAVLRLTGHEIRLWLERAAGAFRLIHPGKADQPLLDPDFPAYNFDVVHGVEFKIDLSRPPMFDNTSAQVSDGRITQILYNDAPLDPQAEFLVVTSDYRAGGVGGYAPRLPFMTSKTLLRDVVAQHLRDMPPTRAEKPFWRFMPMAGTSVTFPTSPRALSHLDEVPHLSLTPLAHDRDGFLTMRLDL
ncbi:bifunctional 2',3'-cyclic-nucleotide 2'-phosphodiesterase/3'-nucleotidase [Falsirhodobacter deserti]|uniref:bifunctional 2',3'-cyclic-nucleotide 2'-phosphodiesterase/3'-nucleotidase n=1 Tax=Falsirhodobacter deserti TaxID=1365611 RepID=UPI000FE2CB1E|nr:bifunctional 2',3'-cyclic-nucleotide 2'-phosphodiesterase/3'-nucleotidase [Falsirhodobacter deserti]